MKLLLVGDPHAKPGDLEDCTNLAVLVARVATDEKVDAICWLGDQHHHHSIVHVEVMAWWMNVLQAMQSFHHIMLVGNHDLGNGDEFQHALLPYRHLATVVDEPKVVALRTRPPSLDTLDSQILFVPFMRDRAGFLQACQDDATETVICHQTFDGSRYENGFYAEDGVDANLLPQKLVISGHIHSPQQFGKVWYPGAPRWQTMSDANEDRAIWVVTFEDGRMVDRKPYSTNQTCRQIRHLVDMPDQPADLTGLEGARVMVDLRGPTEWIQTRQAQLAGRGWQIRTFPTDLVRARVKESEGIGVAFGKFFQAFQPQHGTDKRVLASMLKERVNAARTV